MNRHYKTLELDKILERLAGMTSIEDAREMALNLEPVFELKKVEQLLQQTDDAVALSGRFGAPSFGGAEIVRDIYAEHRQAVALPQANFCRLRQLSEQSARSRSGTHARAEEQALLTAISADLFPTSFLRTKSPRLL